MIRISDAVEQARIDRSAIEVSTLADQGDDGAYWATKSPRERMEALELIRQIVYGYDPATTRLQGYVEVFECQWR